MKPRVVVFTGGEAHHADISKQSGAWLCTYLPRSKYDVVPVEVLPDGQWKVPLGQLPKSGNVARAMDMIFQATLPKDPKSALARLLEKPVHFFTTLLRGKGGDDGSLHGLGSMLDIRVAGSPRTAMHTTFHKDRLLRSLSHIAPTPHSQMIMHDDSLEDIEEDIWSSFIPPFFIKPVHGAGSHGVVKVRAFKDLRNAILDAKQKNIDLLVQEMAPGLELAITMYADARGKLHTLPPTIITPKAASYYDYAAKQNINGAHFHPVHETDTSVIHQAEQIAQDVYRSLRLGGIATIDMIANDGAVDVLDVNTVPSFHAASPIHHQLKHAGIHPEQFLDGLFD